MAYSQPSIALAKEMLKYLPKRPNYNEWLLVISAIGNSFDQQTALEILLSYFQDESPNEHLYKLQHTLSGVNFASLVYIAKQYGFNNKAAKYKRNSKRGRAQAKRHQRFLDNMKDDPKILNQFDDYEMEERAAIYEFDANMPRYEAEQKLINESPESKRIRVFRVSINYHVINKNINPKTGRKHHNFFAYTNGFKNYHLTIQELADLIKEGYAFCPCHLQQDDNEKCKKKSDNFLYSELIAIDIDNGLSLEKCLKMEVTRSASIIYTTCSHTEKKNRYRLIFALPRLIYDKEIYSQIVAHYIKQFDADGNCKDPARGYYGNNNTNLIINHIGGFNNGTG